MAHQWKLLRLFSIGIIFMVSCVQMRPHKAICVVDSRGVPISGAVVNPSPIGLISPGGTENRSGADGIIVIYKMKDFSQYQITALDYETKFIAFPDKDGQEVILNRAKSKPPSGDDVIKDLQQRYPNAIEKK